MKIRLLVLIVVGFVLFVTMGLSMASISYQINQGLFSSGGGTSSSDSYSVRGSLGQTVIGPFASENYRVGSGAWYAGKTVGLPATGESFDLTLYPDWNFVGTPLNPDSTAIAEFFEPVAGDISEVYGIWSFMHTSPGEWHSCVPIQVGQEYIWPGDLTNLETGMGCWVYATTQCVLTINGTPVEFPFAITLYPGWNQVSFPIFGETRTVTDLFAEIAGEVSPIYGVWTFDASTGQWFSCVPILVGQDYFWPGDLATVYPGMSYWVYVDSECVLPIYAQ